MPLFNPVQGSANVTGLRKSAGAGSTDVAATGADVAGLLAGQSLSVPTINAPTGQQLLLNGATAGTIIRGASNVGMELSPGQAQIMYGAAGLTFGGGSTAFNSYGPISCNQSFATTGALTGGLPGAPVGEYTLSTLPAASANGGKYASISNPASGKSYLARSDNTNWRYVADQSIAV